MFVVNTEDNSIYVTRGDAGTISVSAKVDGANYVFRAGDVVRFKVTQKKACENVVLQKDFPITVDTEIVDIYLSEKDTKIGDVISKPVDYWYEVELNPFTNPQTIIGYDDDGAKIFKLHPEGRDLVDEPTTEEDVPVVDTDLSLTSSKPVENKVIARAVVNLNSNIATLESKLAEEKSTRETQQANLQATLTQATNKISKDTYLLETRMDTFTSLPEGSTTADAEIIDARITQTGGIHSNLGNAIRYVESLVRKTSIVSAIDNAISFNTTDKTLSILTYIYVTERYKRYDVAPTTEPLSYAGGTQTFKYLVLDYDTKELKIVDFDKYNNKDIIVFLFSTTFITNPNFVSYPHPYLVDGVQYGKTKTFNLCEIVTGDTPSFDSSTGEMTINTYWYCFYGNKRYIVHPQTVSYKGTSNSRFMVIDLVNSTEANAVLKSIGYDTYNQEQHLVLFTYNQGTIVVKGKRTDINLNLSFIYDGVRYDVSELNLDELSLEKVGYLSPTGDDTIGDGTKTNPFKTFTGAVSKGFNILKCAEGVYKMPSTALSDMDKLKIICEWNGYNADTNPTRKGVVIDNSEDLSMTLNSTTSLLECEYSNTLLDQIFVTKELTIKLPNNSRNANRLDIWKIGETVDTSLKLTPVLTISECQTTENSWTYDGSKIYVNSENAIFKISISSNYGLSLHNINEVVLEDITFLFNLGNGVGMTNCNNVKLRNCHSGYSSWQNGFSLNNCNVEAVNCTAHHNQNDGFNLHYFGNSSFINCQGSYNYDDGISHHEDCNGVVIGGSYHHNGKGGVASPTYGSVVDVHNAMLFNNGVGVYAHEDTDSPKEFAVSNCAIFNNAIGIRSSYKCYSINNRFKDNGTDMQNEYNGSITVI